MELTFEKQTAIRSVSAVFDTDLVNPIVSWSGKKPSPAKCVKDYTVEVFDGSSWHTVADITDNFMRKRTHTFEPISAQKIRLTVTATWGDPSARIMELRAESV